VLRHAAGVKGQAASGSNREGESTEAGRRGGAARSVCLTADVSGGLKSHSARGPGAEDGAGALKRQKPRWGKPGFHKRSSQHLMLCSINSHGVTPSALTDYSSGLKATQSLTRDRRSETLSAADG
jgi:hypothetical protein